MVLVLITTGCGFDDALTRRGFVKEGDAICGQTVVSAAIELQSDPSSSPATSNQFLGTIGQAYGSAAARFRELEVHEEDMVMKDHIVSEFTSISNGLSGAAASAASGDPSAATEANQVFVEARRTQQEIADYGFDICGESLSAR